MWRMLWRDPTVLERAEQWMVLMSPQFRAERFRSFGFSDLIQIGTILTIVLVLGPLLLGGLVILGVMSGSLRGVISSGAVAHLLAAQKQAHRLDVLSMTPGGVFQAAWSIIAYYHLRKEWQNPLVGMSQTALNILTVVAGISALLPSFGLLLEFLSGGRGGLPSDLTEGWFGWVVWALVAIAVLLHDAAVSPLIGAGVGVWGGAGFATDPSNSRLWTSGTYIVIRFAVLGAVLALWWVLSTALALPAWASGLALLAIYVVGHEVLLHAVWRRACEALGCPPDLLRGGWPVPSHLTVVQSNA
jgi:hypothetical protein